MFANLFNILLASLLLVGCTEPTPIVQMLKIPHNRAKIENGYLAIKGHVIPTNSKQFDLVDQDGMRASLYFVNEENGWRFFRTNKVGFTIKAGAIYSLFINPASANSPTPIYFEGGSASLPHGGSEGQILTIIDGEAKWVDSVPPQSVVRKADLSSCGINESLQFNSVTGTFSCAQIQIAQSAVNGLETDLSSFHAVAKSGSYSDLTNKPSIPSKTSQLTNDSSFLTPSSPLKSTNITGSIASSVVSTGAVDFQYANTITLTAVASSTLTATGLQKGGSYTVIIEENTPRTYSLNSPDCSSISYVTAFEPSINHSLLSIIVSDSGKCYVSFMTDL